jgi:hypothetical protein
MNAFERISQRLPMSLMYRGSSSLVCALVLVVLSASAPSASELLAADRSEVSSEAASRNEDSAHAPAWDEVVLELAAQKNYEAIVKFLAYRQQVDADPVAGMLSVYVQDETNYGYANYNIRRASKRPFRVYPLVPAAAYRDTVERHIPLASFRDVDDERFLELPTSLRTMFIELQEERRKLDRKLETDPDKLFAPIRLSAQVVHRQVPELDEERLWFIGSHYLQTARIESYVFEVMIPGGLYQIELEFEDIPQQAIVLCRAANENMLPKVSDAVKQIAPWEGAGDESRIFTPLNARYAFYGLKNNTNDTLSVLWDKKNKRIASLATAYGMSFGSEEIVYDEHYLLKQGEQGYLLRVSKGYVQLVWEEDGRLNEYELGNLLSPDI